MMRDTARTVAVIAGFLVGLVLVVAGAYTLFQGFAIEDDVGSALEEEKIFTAADAAIPEAPVNDADTARAQADIIREHLAGMLSESGITDDNGEPITACAQLPRADELPEDQQHLDGTCTKAISRITALGLAEAAFGVSTLVKGFGVLLILVGAGVFVGFFVFQPRS
jgi:hypothetical protein